MIDPKTEFTCVMCRETFKKAWSDEDASDELAEVFPGFTEVDCVMVCDDCYKKMGY